MTGSQGIAQHVCTLVEDKFKLSPSRSPRSTTPAGTNWVTKDGSYVLDGAEYSITHKLMRTGLTHNSKL